MAESQAAVRVTEFVAGLVNPALVLSEKRVEASNDAAMELVVELVPGQIPGPAPERLFSSLFGEEEAERLREGLTAVLMGRSVSRSVSLVGRTPGGDAGPVSWTVGAVHLAGRRGVPLVLCCLGPTPDRVPTAARSDQESIGQLEVDLIFEMSDELLCIVSPDGGFLRVNASWQRTLGWSPRELLSMKIGELFEEGDAAGILGDAESDRIGGHPVIGLISRVRHRDGSQRWFSWRSERIGERELILVCARDVSERHVTAEALRASEERFRAAAEGGLDSFFILEAERDESGRIRDFRLVDLNQKGEEFLETNRCELLGGSLLSMLELDVGDDFLERCMTVVETRVPIEEEARIGAARQPECWVQMQIAPLGDGIAMTWRDISDRRRIEEERRQSQKMEALGRLAGGVAHDFNNLLTVINGYSDLLMEEDTMKDSPLREEVVEIREAGERAAALTRQLLAFGRQQVLSPSRLDLARVVTNLEKMLRRLIGEHITFSATLERRVPCVMADEGQVEQIVMNLVVNARDAMPHGGRLSIDLREVDTSDLQEPLCPDEAGADSSPPAGRFACLSVRDTGQGMDASTRARVFEPFFTTKGQGEGTGLGLSMVHGIVKQSGGQIAVESEPGRGTIFHVYFPVVAGTATSVRRPEQVSAGAYSGATVLLVEDEAQIRSLGRRVLEDAGFKVLVAKNGVEALRLVERSSSVIDVLVTDVVMPEMSGPELARRLRHEYEDLRVLFVSGYAQNELIPGQQEPGVDFLAKPFRPGEVVHQVAALLAEQR